MQLPHPLINAAQARPDAIALRFKESQWSWQNLLDCVTARAGALRAGGVTPAHRVGLVGPPSFAWVVDLHALGWLGTAVAPIPLDIENPVEQMGPRLSLDLFLRAGAQTDETADPGARRWIVAPSKASPESERFWPLDETRLLMLTSGTTGVPKTVELTTAQLVFSAFGSAIRLGHLPDDCWLCPLPLHHVGGVSVLMRALIYGITVDLRDGFVASDVARALDEGKATHVSLTPKMLSDVLAARPAKPFPETVRTVLVGGAPTSHELIERCNQLAVPLAVTWGMSEAASQVCTWVQGDTSQVGTVGSPLPWTRVDVGLQGLTIRGPTVGGQLETNDYGYLDDAGRVVVQGRIDDVINSGGLKIDPSEIEGILMEHPDIDDAGVAAVAHDSWGQRPFAWCVPTASDAVHSTQEMRTWCRRRLSGYKIPDHFAWVEALPRSPVGKLNRALLRSWVVGQQTKSTETVIEELRTGTPLELGETDEGMLEPNSRPQVVVTPSAANIAGEEHGTLAERIDAKTEDELVAPADGGTETCFGVHQGHPKSFHLEKLGESTETLVEHLLKANVGVFEKTPEEQNSRLVYFVEPCGQNVLESHNRAPKSDVGEPKP